MIKTDSTIIADLRHIARTRQEVELLNVYKGIPILYKAAVEKVGNDRAVVRFQQPEAVCLTLENKTTILTDLLAGPVNAAVLSVDLAAGSAALGEFHYAHAKVGDRMTLRVAPHDAVEVTIQSGQQRVTGSLADLSMTGIGVYISPPDEATALRRKSVVQITLKLEAALLDLSGTVHYVKSRANASRVGLTLVQTPQARTIVQYIHKRQEDILRELHTLYQASVGSGP